MLPVNSYPSGNSPSVHEYLISVPLLNLGKFSTLAVHPLLSFNVTSVPFDNVTVRLSGRIPSWSSASAHTFFTVASVFSGL